MKTCNRTHCYMPEPDTHTYMEQMSHTYGYKNFGLSSAHHEQRNAMPSHDSRAKPASDTCGDPYISDRYWTYLPVSDIHSPFFEQICTCFYLPDCLG